MKTAFKKVPVHDHAEAYCHMTYQCLTGRHRFRIWNSRDGVTPFTMRCLEAGCESTMQHVDWGDDVYDPLHQLQPGDYYWRDGTQAEAEAILLGRLQAYPPPPEYLAERGCETLEEYVKLLVDPGDELSEFQPGWPQLDRHAEQE